MAAYPKVKRNRRPVREFDNGQTPSVFLRYLSHDEYTLQLQAVQMFTVSAPPFTQLAVQVVPVTLRSPIIAYSEIQGQNASTMDASNMDGTLTLDFTAEFLAVGDAISVLNAAGGLVTETGIPVASGIVVIPAP